MIEPTAAEAFQANAVRFMDALCDNVLPDGSLVQPQTEYRANALVFDLNATPEERQLQHKRNGYCPHRKGTSVESCVTGETVAWICDGCGEQVYDKRWLTNGN